MDLSLEQIAQLQTIFMPEATRLRLKLRNKQEKDWGEPGFLRFAHYTSAEAALKILSTKRLWLRNSQAMADYSEVRLGLTMLRNYFADQAKTAAFIAALDACAPGAARQALDAFDEALRKLLAFNVFVSSASEHCKKEEQHGRLSMWRAFGGQTSRVAIVFKVPWISDASEELGVIFSPVAYMSEIQVHSAVDEVIANVRRETPFLRTLGQTVIHRYVYTMLLAAVTCLKHEGFDEEREWRTMYTPLFPSPLVESQVITSAGVPQVIHVLPLDKNVSPKIADVDLHDRLERVIIGPSPYPWVIASAFLQEFQKLGIPNPENKIVWSHIPIRQ